MTTTQLIAGVDEVGRGPLAGPVVAAAVLCDPAALPLGLRDSKQLTARAREQYAAAIHAVAMSVGVAMATPSEIDDLNILQASLLAMRRAILQLTPIPQQALIDGRHCPDQLPCAAQAIVRGDATVPLISAASIVAKVARDQFMLTLDARYPEYGFAQHKGYPTAAHLAALQRFGPCPEHRYSFRPVRIAAAITRESAPVNSV